MQALERCLNILNCIAMDSQNATLDELTKKSGLNKATCYRLLQSMKDLDLVEQNENSKKYSLGKKLIGLGLTALSNLDLVKLTDPIMKKLKNETKENVNLAILDNREIMFIKRIGSDFFMSVHHRVGSRFPIHCTSLGKAILAHLPQSEADEIIKNVELKRFTSNTHTSINSLKKELQKIREQRFAVSIEEMEKGLIAVASPILNHERFPVAAIGLSYSTVRYDESEYATIFKEKLLNAANEISTYLGFAY